ncbi:MAG: PEP-CTERM sorting domain-containing protein [Bryobacteraceae bacterium]
MLLVAGSALGTPIPGLVSTGQGSPTSPDPNWEFFYSPVPVTTGFVFSPAYITDSSTYPFPAWTNNAPNSQWISPQAGYGNVYGNYADPAGYYWFRITFNLGPGYDPNTATFTYMISTDNLLNSAWVNGHLVHPGSMMGYTSMTGPFTVGGPGIFQPGLNSFVLIVYNFPAVTIPENINSWNPAGVNVEILSSYVSYTPPPPVDTAIPEPATFFLCGAGLLAVGFLGRRIRR